MVRRWKQQKVFFSGKKICTGNYYGYWSRQRSRDEGIGSPEKYVAGCDQESRFEKKGG